MGKVVKRVIGRFWLIAGIVVTLELVVAGGWWLLSNPEQLETLNPLGKRRGEVILPKGKEVVGFLPTWMVGKTKYYGKELTQLIFLGVEVSEKGKLVWDVQGRKIDNDDYLKLKANVKRNGGKNILGIKLFEDKKLDKLIKSEEARETLKSEVAAIVKAGDFEGVNIDFEYMGNPTRIMDSDFLSLMREAKEAGWGEVSVDVFANTVIKGSEERLKMLLDSVDKVIVMAYDFHRPGSDFAGPVAPIRDEPGQRSISEITEVIAKFGLPREKFILAYPLYGYQWETVSGEKGAATMPNGYGVTVLYKEGIGYTGMKWDEMAQSPWYAWTEKEQRSRVVTKKVGRHYRKVTEKYEVDQWHQAELENQQSLEIKVDWAKKADVGGIGFWALGYEGKESNLIQELEKRMR